MKKGNRRSKQTAEASAADDYEKRVRELEIENKAFQVEIPEFKPGALFRPSNYYRVKLNGSSSSGCIHPFGSIFNWKLRVAKKMQHLICDCACNSMLLLE